MRDFLASLVIFVIALDLVVFILAGVALVYPGAYADLLGLALVLAALTLQYLRKDLPRLQS